jgi:hypothetical protein
LRVVNSFLVVGLFTLRQEQTPLAVEFGRNAGFPAPLPRAEADVPSQTAMSTGIFSGKVVAGRPKWLCIQGRPDATGAWHHLNTTTGEIVVVRNRGIEHRETLDQRTVDEWKQFVAERRGWSEREPTVAGAMVEGSA